MPEQQIPITKIFESLGRTQFQLDLANEAIVQLNQELNKRADRIKELEEELEKCRQNSTESDVAQ